MSAVDSLSHSLVIASDYRVPDPERVWPLLTRRRSALADIGAHHVLLYTSTHDHGRVLVTIGVRSREPIVELLRSRVFFEWFDAVGVDDLPAVFAGEIVGRFGSGARAERAAQTEAAVSQDQGVMKWRGSTGAGKALRLSSCWLS